MYHQDKNDVSRRKSSLLIVAIMLFLAVLACDFVQNLGTLAANSTPVPFRARGETVHIWEAIVTPGHEYEIIVEPLDVTGRHDGADILVQDGERNTIASAHTMKNGAEVVFVGPASGQIIIKVIGSIGQDQVDLGTFSIELREVEN